MNGSRTKKHRPTDIGGSTAEFLADLIKNSIRTDASDTTVRECSQKLLCKIHVRTSISRDNRAQ